MKRWTIRIGCIVILAPVTSYVLGNIDYWRISHDQKPFFVFQWTGFFDGGTYMGPGFGYFLRANHGTMYAMERGKTPFSGWYWTEGPELEFWFFPFLGKSDLKFRDLTKPS